MRVPFPGRLALACLGALVIPTLLDAQSWFRRGDAGGDGRVDIDDAVRIDDFLFLGGPPFACFDAADADDDGLILPVDALMILAWSTGVGPEPPAPGPFVCGDDPSLDPIGCLSYSCAFVRGDANGDGLIDPADGVAIGDYLFLGTPLPCLDAADVDDDGVIAVADSILVALGLPLPLPGSLVAGPDYTADGLDCQMYSQTVFLRGDSDGDCDVDTDDYDAIFDFLFVGGAPLFCPAGADVLVDGLIDIADSLFLLAFLSAGGPPPPAPFPICGIDPPSVAPCDSGCVFIRGDADGDGQVDEDDALAITDYLFLGAAPPGCFDAADANDDGLVDGMDPVAVLASLGIAGPPLVAPGPHVCGVDPTPDALNCVDYLCLVPNDFRRGDCNVDGSFDIADAIFALGILFPPPGPAAACLDACDSNDSGFFDIADPIFTLASLFIPGSPVPPAPNPDCGYDPTPVDAVGCEDYSSAECP